MVGPYGATQVISVDDDVTANSDLAKVTSISPLNQDAFQPQFDGAINVVNSMQNSEAIEAAH